MKIVGMFFCIIPFVGIIAFNKFRGAPKLYIDYIVKRSSGRMGVVIIGIAHNVYGFNRIDKTTSETPVSVKAGVSVFYRQLLELIYFFLRIP